MTKVLESLEMSRPGLSGVISDTRDVERQGALWGKFLGWHLLSKLVVLELDGQVIDYLAKS